jgi:glycine oxidase
VNSPDVIIAGAGLVGLCSALELRKRGAEVLVVERAEPGSEASSAAAGMLAPADPETPAALRAMAVESARIYPDFVAGLESISGMKVDFRRQGTIVIGEHAPPANHSVLSQEELHRLEGAIDSGERPVFLVEEDSVDPVLLMRAVTRAARVSGIEIRTGITVQRMRGLGATVEVESSAGSLKAKVAVNCLGAWSGPPVRPRKGQMMYVEPARPGLLQHVVRAPGAYIVPRSSGKILIGTTLEDVGFDKTVHPEAIRGMHDAAVTYVPALAAAEIVETWAGFRPGSPDDLPLIGCAEERNLIVASGMFRNGILLAPITARIVADLITATPASLDIAAFSPMRFAEFSAFPPVTAESGL